jgi:hypothetical protein
MNWRQIRRKDLSERKEEVGFNSALFDHNLFSLLSDPS